MQKINKIHRYFRRYNQVCGIAIHDVPLASQFVNKLHWLSQSTTLLSISLSTTKRGTRQQHLHLYIFKFALILRNNSGLSFLFVMDRPILDNLLTLEI